MPDEKPKRVEGLRCPCGHNDTTGLYLVTEHPGKDGFVLKRAAYVLWCAKGHISAMKTTEDRATIIGNIE